LFIIFRALNYISDKSIVELIVYNISSESNTDLMDLLVASIDEAKQINSQKLALEYISKYIIGLQAAKYRTNKCKAQNLLWKHYWVIYFHMLASLLLRKRTF